MKSEISSSFISSTFKSNPIYYITQLLHTFSFFQSLIYIFIISRMNPRRVDLRPAHVHAITSDYKKTRDWFLFLFCCDYLFDLNSCERSEKKKFGSFGCWEMAKIRLENRTNLKNRTAFVRCKIIYHVMCLFFSIQLRYGQSIYLKPDQNFNYFLLSAVLRSIRVDCLDRVRETSENAEGIQRDYNDRRAPDAVASLPCTSTCDSTRHTHF